MVYTKEYATIFRDSSVHMHKITFHLAPVIINYQLCHIALFVEGAVHLPTKAIALQCYTYIISWLMMHGMYVCCFNYKQYVYPPEIEDILSVL